MVSYTGRDVDSVPLVEATGGIRTVSLDGEIVRSARALGMSLGD
jgi:hypothetical protein